MHIMLSWYYNKTVQFLETCPWREGIKGRSGEGMYNDCPLLHPHNTELFDIKLDLTTLPSPADNSAKLLLIRFQRLLRIVRLFSRKCKNPTKLSHTISQGERRTDSATDVKHLKPGTAVSAGSDVRRLSQSNLRP